MNTVEREWVVHDPPSEVVERLADALDLDPIVARVLANRDFTRPDTAKQGLEPGAEQFHPPDRLPAISAVSERLLGAIEGNEDVLVYADRDIDGVVGAVALVRAFELLDRQPDTFVPGKWDGYGLDGDELARFAGEGYDIVVTVDCGSKATGAVQTGLDHGLDIVVTDHHDAEATLPAEVPCVNPRLPESDYPNDDLAGGALAYKLGRYLVQGAEPAKTEAYDRDGLVLAALATLGDYMSLTTENRAIVREGYERLGDTTLAGVRAVVEHCGVDTLRDLGWSVVPLMKAAQGEETGALLFEAVRGGRDTADVIERLEALREERRREREAWETHLLDRIDEETVSDDLNVLFVDTDRYVGGVAVSRVAERFGRPVVVLREKDGQYIANARCEADIDFLELYAACEDHLDEYWGHPGAAGFRADPDAIDTVRTRLRSTLRERYDPGDLRPTVDIDARVAPAAIDADLVETFDQLAPFGNGNERPTFLLEGVELESVRLFGSDREHVELLPANNVELSLRTWNGGEAAQGLTAPLTADVVGELGWDDYRERPALDVLDYRGQG